MILLSTLYGCIWRKTYRNQTPCCMNLITSLKRSQKSISIKANIKSRVSLNKNEVDPRIVKWKVPRKLVSPTTEYTEGRSKT